MRKRNSLLVMSIFITSLLIALMVNPVIAASNPLKWRMSTVWTPSVPYIEADRYFVKTINEITNGQLKIDFFEGGSLIPPMQVFEAVSKGTLQAGGDAAIYWAGKDTAFELLTSFPFGLTPIDYMVWINQGGGFELYQEVYGKYGMVYLPTIAVPVESGLRSNKPITSIADMKGLNVRMVGQTQGKILKEIGASQIMLATAEVYQALEKKVIDAAENGGVSIDWAVGMQEVTKFWATPGWHQPASILGVTVNKKAWDTLPPYLKQTLKTTAMATFMWSFSFLDYSNIDATKKFIEHGTTITKWKEEDMKRLQELTNKFALQSCQQNPLFAKVLYSQMKFLKDTSQWRSVAGPFGYGRNPELPDLNAIKSYIK